MKEKVGKSCRVPDPAIARGAWGGRDGSSARVLVVDPEIDSRCALVRCLGLSGIRVDAAAGANDALRALSEEGAALVLAAMELGDRKGLCFLTDLRRIHPGVERALLVDRARPGFTQRAIEQADLAFVLEKPWETVRLRRTVRRILDGGRRADGWRILRLGHEGLGPATSDPTGSQRGWDLQKRVRRLLTDLNACEREREVVQLLDSEIAPLFGIQRWLWVDEGTSNAIRISRGVCSESHVSAAGLTLAERRALERVGDRQRPGAIEADPMSGLDAPDQAVFTMSIQCPSQPPLRCVLWADGRHSSRLVAVLRDLRFGVRNALSRIRQAEARAAAARSLARRVSDEIRTPAGALAHAIDRLRADADRAGMPPEWMERVSLESRRLMAAVEDFEGDLFEESQPSTSTSG